MSEIETLARRGASIMHKLKAREDPKLRAEVIAIAAQIEQSWSFGDVTVESWPSARIAASKAGDLDDDLVRPLTCWQRSSPPRESQSISA